MSTMQAIHITTPGGPEVLKLAEVPKPIPNEGEVLIQVAASGVNAADILQRKGKYPPPPGVSTDIPGLEVAGTILEVAPNVTSHKPGDKVAALHTGAGYAEFVTVPAVQCLPWINHFTPVQMAALPEAACTVWSNLFQIAQAKTGETILIHGGTSGIGSLAIQLCVAKGLTVLTTSSSQAKCQHCLNWGAALAINYKEQSFKEAVLSFTHQKGVNIIFDLVGGSYLADHLELLAPRGRLVTISTQGGRKADLDLGLVMRKQLTLTGSMLRPRSVSEKGEIVAAVLQNVWPLLQSGKVIPIVDSVFKFTEASKAHHKLEVGSVVGKVILIPDNTPSAV